MSEECYLEVKSCWSAELPHRKPICYWALSFPLLTNFMLAGSKWTIIHGTGQRLVTQSEAGSAPMHCQLFKQRWSKTCHWCLRVQWHTCISLTYKYKMVCSHSCTQRHYARSLPCTLLLSEMPNMKFKSCKGVKLPFHSWSNHLNLNF